MRSTEPWQGVEHESGAFRPLRLSERRRTDGLAGYGRRLRQTRRYLIPDDGRRSSGRTLDSTHAEVFDFQIVLDAVFRALTAVAALLDPAERCNLGRDQ